jgi:hypothetical protein
MNPEDLMEITRNCGHASTQTTLSTYAHSGHGSAEAKAKLPHFGPVANQSPVEFRIR